MVKGVKMDKFRALSATRAGIATAALVRRMRSDERGMTTAEYAVGTIAAAGLGGLLVKLLSSEEMRQLLWGLLSGLLGSFIR